MQGEAMKVVLLAKEPIVLALPVAHIADDGMTGVLEVAADLMRATSPRKHFVQAIAAMAAQQAEIRACILALAVTRFASQRMIDVREPWIIAATERQIALGDEAALERALQIPRDLRIEGEEERAARLTVQTMNGVYRSPQLLAQGLESYGFVVTPTAMHQLAARLVYANEPIVLVQDG